MDVEAQIRIDMKNLGCESEMKITLAFHLYIYLVDKKLMYDTEYCYNSDIDILYVVARPRKDQKLNIYVPIPTRDELSMEFINKLQENLCTIETGPSINFAFIESDFTIVIYTFTRGIQEKMSPFESNLLKKHQEKRRIIDNELALKKQEILNDALNGGLVEDDDT